MNKVILMGRLTKDVELKYTGENTAVANFTLAVPRKYVKPGEERQADFLNIVAWGKLGEFTANYFQKGQQVAVTGRIQIRTWDDDQGKRNYFTEIVAEDAYFADSKREGAPTGGNKPTTAGKANVNSAPTQGEFYPVNDDDDELPF